MKRNFSIIKAHDKASFHSANTAALIRFPIAVKRYHDHGNSYKENIHSWWFTV